MTENNFRYETYTLIDGEKKEVRKSDYLDEAFEAYDAVTTLALGRKEWVEVQPEVTIIVRDMWDDHIISEITI